MDDLKLFSRDKTELQKELTIVKTFSDKLRTDFDVFLTVHLSIISTIDQLNAQILVFNKFIIFPYMFRAQQCSKHVGEYNKLINNKNLWIKFVNC